MYEPSQVTLPAGLQGRATNPPRPMPGAAHRAARGPVSVWVKERFLVGTGILLALLAASAPSTAEAGRYYHKERGFSLALPDGWQVIEAFMGTAVTAVSPLTGVGDQPRQTVCVLVEDLKQPVTLDEYFTQTLAAVRATSGYEEHGTGELTIDEAPARWLAFTGRTGAGSATVVIYLLIKGRCAFIISCIAAPDEFVDCFPVFERIALSLRCAGERDGS